MVRGKTRNPHPGNLRSFNQVEPRPQNGNKNNPAFASDEKIERVC